MKPFRIKRGDKRPPFRATLTDSDGNSIDVQFAVEIRLHLRRAGSSVVQLDQEMDIVLNDTVKYDWQDGDTDVAGSYEAEIAVQFVDGIETFPNGSHIPVVIFEDIK